MSNIPDHVLIKNANRVANSNLLDSVQAEIVKQIDQELEHRYQSIREELESYESELPQ